MHSPSVEESEVLIAGAGPAGCTAGILLARKGVRVVILEKREPSHQKICGDMLGPRALWLLGALRVGWERKQAEGTQIRAIGIYDEKRMKSWAYFGDAKGKEAPALTVKRDVFDGFLRQKALEAGCKIHYGLSFHSFHEQETKAVVCRARDRGQERLFRVRLVLAADGVNSRVARSAGLDSKGLQYRILAVRGYFKNVKGLRDSIEFYFMRRILPGYAWVIPLGRTLANVGLGIRADVCAGKRIRLQAELKRFVREHPSLAPRMREAEPSGNVQGWAIGSYGGERRRCGNRLLLLGDAGSFSDPLTGEGIYGAMQSAFLAVPVVLQAFQQGDFSGALLARYDREARICFDAANKYATWLSSLPSHHRLLQPMVMWGLDRVEKNCVIDTGYARMVGGFFTGMIPRKRMWNRKWFRRTFLG